MLIVRVLRVCAGVLRVLRQVEAAQQVAEGGVDRVDGLAQAAAVGAAVADGAVAAGGAVGVAGKRRHVLLGRENG